MIYTEKELKLAKRIINSYTPIFVKTKEEKYFNICVAVVTEKLESEIYRVQWEEIEQ